jgi:O-antigen ligase
MPPIIALMFCMLFVAFLLKLDKAQSRGVSPGLWIATIWTFYCASRPVGVWLSSGSYEMDIEEGSASDRIFLSVLLICGIFILARKKLNWVEVIKDNRWIVMLYVFMALSLFWSDYPWISFKRWIKAFGSLLMAFVVLSEASPKAAIETILRRTAYVLIPFSILVIKYFPYFGVEYDRWEGRLMWIGVTTQKNCLGRLCLISAFYLLWKFVRRRQHRELRVSRVQTCADVAILILALWLLKGPSMYAASATAMVTLIFGVALFLCLVWLKRSWKGLGFKLVFPIVSLGIGLGIAIPLIGGTALADILSILGRDTTFTGRTYIWGELLPIASKHSILGLGYGSFWIHPPDTLVGLNEAHNGYLEVFLELGLVGVFLLLGFLFSLCLRAQRALSSDFDWAAFTICLLLMALFHNITEASFGRTGHIWTVLIFLGVLMSRLGQRNNTVKTTRRHSNVKVRPGGGGDGFETITVAPSRVGSRSNFSRGRQLPIS